MHRPSTAPISVNTLDGGQKTVEPQELETLEMALHGTLITPVDPSYDKTRAVWNGMIDRKPGLIARCVGVADVQLCVRFARQNNLLLSIKGGGHNIAGLAVADGAFTLDMSAMRGVFVDNNRNIARAQAGCILGTVDRETQIHGKVAVLGFVSQTGITGLTLGGGFGYLSRKYGWTSDNVTAFELVTADGEIVSASDSENTDLFWCLRGGGGNFGVVTAIDYKLYSVGPEVYAGAIAWKAEDAPQVLQMYREFIEKAPREVHSAAIMRCAPTAPWLPADMHGKPVIVLLYVHAGSLADGEAGAKALKTFGAPIGDVIQPRPYLQQQSLLDATQPNGRRYYWKSDYTPGLSQELIDTYMDHAAKITSPHSAAILFPIDGALNELPETHSAVGNRDAHFVFNITAAWDEPTEDDAQIKWARDSWSALKEFSTGGTYINFLNADETADRIKDAYGANYQKLVEGKKRWDPDNFFRTNKNIS